MERIIRRGDLGACNRRVALLSVAVAFGLAAGSVAAQTRKPLPPTQMRYPLEWAFKAPPPRGTVTPGSACEVAEEYVRQINAQRPAMGIADLFAEDGALFQGGGKLLRGRGEIHAFYSTTDAGAGVIPLSFIDNGAECVMEIAIQAYGPNEPWRLAGARHFTMTPDRKISRLVFFGYDSVPSATGRQGQPQRR